MRRLSAPLVLAILPLPGCASDAGPPPVVTPVVVATHPHDASAFTQGLLYRGGELVESTGQIGASTVRRVEIATGRVIAQADVPQGFGEGVVDWGDTLYSVTWKGGQGYRWDAATLASKGAWRYEGEGWGMTRDATHIILSDGTPVLRFLDPATLTVARTLRVTNGNAPVANLNELEMVRGELWANVWMTDRIARIDPATGIVKGWVDVAALRAQAGAAGDADAVANGIAYDEKGDRLFLTGKYWPLLFEVRVPRS